MNADTVFAVASGAGRAAIAILRISGPDSAAALTALCGPLPTPRRAVVRALRDADGELLDRAMVLWLPGPESYTGEDSAELDVHAGRAVIDAVADRLTALGLRPAEPGEFTRRAFLNGKLDLVSAEAVHDLVAAETDAQRRQALRQLDGALGDLYRGWSDRLRGALARQEALIDFPDEDLPPEVEADLLASVRSLRQEIAVHLDDRQRGEKLREGLCFAITGAPNVGKSSLINALAERDVAIVSATPGTTRDAIETRIVLAGVPVTLVDTAGLRDTTDPIEAEGVRRARARAAAADLVLEVIEAGSPIVSEGGRLLVANKSDLCPERRPGVAAVSALTGAGLPALRARLAAEATALTQSSGPPPLTRARHRTALLAAARWLAEAEDAIEPELRGEAMRLALRALGTITGQVGVEDILDSIFRQFCIGK
ncbi:MAG TPA: tRNA uridine-5-carboxymethylaminomethyl(34) synthesis GTPase MnmE [Acetobacteraceae bacterium]|nr:tRNA uridine-5-carboxymethylaminomethyl(34) synthesis GTPase MnmE [Acetobacteraceae bacterium]